MAPSKYACHFLGFLLERFYPQRRGWLRLEICASENIPTLSELVLWGWQLSFTHVFYQIVSFQYLIYSLVPLKSEVLPVLLFCIALLETVLHTQNIPTHKRLGHMHSPFPWVTRHVHPSPCQIILVIYLSHFVSTHPLISDSNMTIAHWTVPLASLKGQCFLLQCFLLKNLSHKEEIWDVKQSSAWRSDQTCKRFPLHGGLLLFEELWTLKLSPSPPLQWTHKLIV